MTTQALDSIFAAYAASGDARLLIPALDLCETDEDRAKALDAAKNVDVVLLDDLARARLAQEAVGVGDHTLALRLADGVEAALASEVRARLATDDCEGALARYHSAVAANPALEQPDLLAELKSASADRGEDAKVLAFNRHPGSSAAPSVEDRTAELDRTRLEFLDSRAVDFSDVGGHDAVKKQIDRRIIAPFRKPTLFAKFRRKAGGGVLLYGPPGCGKTLLARATAGECNARFINVPITDVLDKYIGEPERKLAAIFEDARRETPSVLFFDELEALAGKRGGSSSHHELGVVSTFLSELDGFAQNNDGVLILAATNIPWAVDPAFRRSGRFDRQLFVPPPDNVARLEILRIQCENRPVSEKLNLAAIASKTIGFSGADLRNLVDTAADFAIEESIDAGREVPISTSHFTEAMEEVKATTAEWLTTARNFAKYGNSGGQYDEVADFISKHAK